MCSKIRGKGERIHTNKVPKYCRNEKTSEREIQSERCDRAGHLIAHLNTPHKTGSIQNNSENLVTLLVSGCIFITKATEPNVWRPEGEI